MEFEANLLLDGVFGDNPFSLELEKYSFQVVSYVWKKSSVCYFECWTVTCSFAWLELISHRMFMPKLLMSNSQKGWPLFQRLLVALFKFMEPYLRNADVSDPVSF